MVTIFKNMTTTLITFGDFAFFNQPLSQGILSSVFLMVGSSIVAGYHDLAFDFYGYIWQAFNCFVSAGYVLYMRHAMKKNTIK